MQFKIAQLLYVLAFVPLGRCAPVDEAHNGGIEGNHQILKRADGEVEATVLWGDKPQPQHVRQLYGNDWFLCGAASIAEINPDAIKRLITGKNEPSSRKRGLPYADVKLWSLAAKDWVTKQVSYDELPKDFRKEDYYWWSGALDLAAKLIKGTDAITDDGFSKDHDIAKADIGLRMLTGLETFTQEIDIDKNSDMEDKKELWNILEIPTKAKSPLCVWDKEDKKWFGVLSTEEQTGNDFGKVNLYDIQNHKRVAKHFNEIKGDISLYSMLKESKPI